MSRFGIIRTVLTTQLAEALEKDQIANNTYSPANDLWGDNVSAWIQETAKYISDLQEQLGENESTL